MSGPVTALLLAMLGLLVEATVLPQSYRYSLPGSLLWPGRRDWQQLKERLTGDLYVRNSAGYNLTELYSLPFFNRRNGEPQPAAIAEPEDADDVQKLVLFAKRHQIRIAVFNTGHNNDVRSTGDNTLLIRMKRLNSVTVDVEHATAVIGGGADFADVAAAVTAASNGRLVAVTGTVPSVGVYGWAVGGGLGPMTRLYGYGVDNILAATVVTGEGKIVMATADNEHSDLLYAIKGGGGPSFGVGLSLTMRLHPNPGPMRAFVGLFPKSDAVSDLFADVLVKAPYSAFTYYLGSASGTVQILAYCAGATVCDEFMAGILALPMCIAAAPGLCTEFALDFPTSFYQIMGGDGGFEERYEWVMGGTRTEDLKESYRSMNAWSSRTEAVAYPYDKNCFAEFNLGGVASMIDPTACSSAISPAMRQISQYVMCSVSWNSQTPVSTIQYMVNDLRTFDKEHLQPQSPQQWVYWNEAPHDMAGDSWKVRYWGSLEKYNKLLAIKLRYDPLNFITCHHCVGWDFSSAVDPLLCPSPACSCSNNPTGACSTF